MNIFSKYFTPKSIFCKRKHFFTSNIYNNRLFIGETFLTKHISFINTDCQKQIFSFNISKICNSSKSRPIGLCHLQNKVHSFLNLRRNLSTNSLLYRYREGLSDNIVYEPSPKGRYRRKERPKREDIKEGFTILKAEIRKWKEEMKVKFEADPIFVRPGDTDKLYDFESEEDLKLWMVSTDKDNDEGQSQASLTFSPAGHALFSGEIDTTVPKDGQAAYTGWGNMSLIQPRRSFKREKPFDWMCYTHLVLRIRGDGRRYMLTLKTSGQIDLSWHDVHVYVLYTRGGPYWQDVKIPFSKFFLSATGRAQDKQSPLPLDRVKSMGITASGGISGPFRLEIDYIGVHCDPTMKERFAYEMYHIPGVTNPR